MKIAGLPPNEEQRLIAVKNYLTTSQERIPALDDLARLVALSLDVPIALVSLVDERVLRLRARVGVELDTFDRSTSFCSHVVRQGVTLVVPSVLADARFADSPLALGFPNARFYAGAPLRADDGNVVGVLSVIDRNERSASGKEQRLLELFANQAMMHLEAQRNARLLHVERELLRVHREFFQLTPELHCTLDASLRFDELSPSWESVLGWKREVLRAQTLADLLHPEDAPRALGEAQRLIRQQGSRYDFETRCQHLEGHWIPLSWSWLARGGRLFATARDMTGYHAKEDALLAANRELQDREQKLRVLFDSMAEGAMMQDAEGTVTHLNAAAERILRTTRAELSRQNAHGPALGPLVRRDGSLMPDVERPTAHALKTGEVVSDRVMGLLSAEGTTWISVNAVPLRGALSSRPNGVVTTFRDISEHYRMQESLAQSEANFRALVASLPIGIAVSHGRVMRYVNQALVEILGYDEADELVGRETLSVVHPRSEQAIRERYAQIATGIYPAPGVLECVKRDGGSVLVEVASMPTRYDGQDATIAIVRDVTETQRAKQALLESLGQKETLLKEIHHRVKNNLQVIASLLRLGRNYVEDPAALSVFNDSIARVHSIALIHERLYQSKDLAVIDLRGYLNGLVSELLRAGTSDRAVHAEVLADPVALDIDRCVPIGLIVNELVTNSLKHAFTDPAARAPEISVRFHEHATRYELVIRDNGKGMGAATRREGSLGLLLVSSLVGQLGGTQGVADDNGTCWRIQFPRDAQDEPFEGPLGD